MAISKLDLNGNATGTDATTTFNEQKAVRLFSGASRPPEERPDRSIR